MGMNFGMTEPGGECPVSLDLLGKVYRAEPASVADMLRDVSQDRRARLALFCYGRAARRSGSGRRDARQSVYPCSLPAPHRTAARGMNLAAKVPQRLATPGITMARPAA